MPFDPEPVDLPELATPQDVADALAQAKTYTDEQVAALAGATPADDEAAETEQNATLADLARRVQILEDEVALPPPATGGAYVGVPYTVIGNGGHHPAGRRTLVSRQPQPGRVRRAAGSGR